MMTDDPTQAQLSDDRDTNFHFRVNVRELLLQNVVEKSFLLPAPTFAIVAIVA